MENLQNKLIHLKLKPTHEMINVIRHICLTEFGQNINYNGNIDIFIQNVENIKRQKINHYKKQEILYKFPESIYLPEIQLQASYDYRNDEEDNDDLYIDSLSEDSQEEEEESIGSIYEPEYMSDANSEFSS